MKFYTLSFYALESIVINISIHAAQSQGLTAGQVAGIAVGATIGAVFSFLTVGAVLGYAQVIHIIRTTPSGNGQVPLIES